jgi:hypothetical protein
MFKRNSLGIMRRLYIDGTEINYATNDSAFKAWLKLVEKEQVKSNILKGIIINRQWLFYLWVNGYSPLEALKDVQMDKAKS